MNLKPLLPSPIKCTQIFSILCRNGHGASAIFPETRSTYIKQLDNIYNIHIHYA